MKRNFGFTLVELLVVIAIISILAAIVTPRVQGYILKARATAAEAEIRGIEIALTKILTDSGRDNLRQLFKNDPSGSVDLVGQPKSAAELADQVRVYTRNLYAVLRQGRNAELTDGLIWDETARTKLGTSYVDLGLDPWDSQYQFFPGKYPDKWQPSDTSKAPMVFRSYKSPAVDPNTDAITPWVYNDTQRDALNAVIPGNPPADNLEGYPASRDLMIYVFSLGVDKKNNQLYNAANTDPKYKGGGDDINNWDKESGWSEFYN